MNIAILHFHRLGGSGVVAYELARAMHKKGHQIHFVGLHPPYRMNQDENLEGFYFHRVTFEPYPVFDFQPYSLALASQLSEIIIDNDINIIHSHYAIPHALVALLARDISGKNVKCITTLHGTDITVVGSHPSMYHIAKYLIEKSDAVTSVSHYLKNKTNELFNLSPARIKMIYNFIDTDSLPDQLDKPRLSEKNELIFLHSSNLREVKSPQDVITIFHEIYLRSSDSLKKKMKLWILGEGPLKANMAKMVREFNLLDKVVFLGERVDLSCFLKQADVFLFPSLEESFGLAALEVMAWGIPVIARRVGGIPELITHGEDGFLFSESLEEAVEMGLTLIQDEVYYQKISERAFGKVRDQFSIKKVFPEFEKLYFG